MSSSPLRDDEGAIRGLICTVWETTDKVLAQRRQGDSEARLQALVDVTRQLDEQRRLKVEEAARRQAQQHEIEARYRLAGLADGHVVWNQALAALFGHDHEQTSADWWLEHIHPEDRPRIDISIRMIGAMLDLTERKAFPGLLRDDR